MSKVLYDHVKLSNSRYNKWVPVNCEWCMHANRFHLLHFDACFIIIWCLQVKVKANCGPRLGKFKTVEIIVTDIFHCQKNNAFHNLSHPYSQNPTILFGVGAMTMWRIITPNIMLHFNHFMHAMYIIIATCKYPLYPRIGECNQIIKVMKFNLIILIYYSHSRHNRTNCVCITEKGFHV